MSEFNSLEGFRSLSPLKRKVYWLPHYLVVGLVEMLSWSLVMSQTVGDTLERNSAIVVANLKTELDESSNSLKATLEALGMLDQKLRQVNAEVDKVKSRMAVLETELDTEKVDRHRVEEEATTK
ncbi:hypothetical protein PHAVU_009G162400 [Phaseolus vulgaris]|uniref:Uncharacterized protein n=1 Tax=Phaseolus vulgaris TaxID=3885 RepID=V7B048_PHAVU|nr:hypothetical protein PHAVU_009G162400g [Phaseolus vulgaris]ESW09861.1 hypothetical protein PHAVU_009G162400g [Phaseolus vulgaris]